LVGVILGVSGSSVWCSGWGFFFWLVVLSVVSVFVWRVVFVCGEVCWLMLCFWFFWWLLLWCGLGWYCVDLGLDWVLMGGFIVAAVFGLVGF